MRILHFAQNVAGGISSYFDEIAAHQLERYGRENVVFLMPGRDVRNLTNVPLDTIETFDHVDRTAPSLFRLALTVRRFTERYRPDIVHLHSTFAGLIFRSVLPFLRHRPKVIYCAHGWAFAREQSAVSTKTFAWIEALLMRNTDLCINISANEERLAAEHGVSLMKCVTVPNGIALRDAPPAEGTTPSDRAIRLLFVGRLDPQKGVDILMQAMRLLDTPAIHLQVAGAAVVSKSGAGVAVQSPNVTALGHVTRDEVAQLMRDCDAIVVPSRWEGFGLVVLEAMRAGKPAIVSPNGALPDLVVDGATGVIVRPLTPETLAAALQSLDRARLEEMGRAAYARFVDHHTSDRMNIAIDQLYERLVARPLPVRLQDSNLPQDPLSNG